MAILSSGVIWEGTPATWNGWPMRGGAGPNYFAPYGSMYRDQLWVGTVIDKRANSTARLPLKVYERDDLNRPEARDHPYAALLRKPNQRMSPFFFWLWISSMRDIFGDTFAGKIRDSGGRPIALIPLHPTCMHEDRVEDGRTIWTFQNGQVRVDNIPDEDLFHPRTFNPESTSRGLSPLEKLRWTLENEEASRRATSSFWRNGARPGVALTHPKSLSQPAADRLKLRWDQLAAGADKTGATIVLEEGMKAEKFTLTAEEAQYIESRKLNREEVCAAYDMPPPVVHILDHATFSNITEQMRSLYRDTMAPLLGGFEAELETQVRGSVRPGADEPDFGDDVYAEFLLDEVLRGDFESRSDSWQKRIFAGMATPAEARRAENLPFIEGSDRLFINSTMVPLEGNDDEGAKTLSLVEQIQKIYLGVGVVISAEEAREILNRSGAGLVGPAPLTGGGDQVLDASEVRSLMGRLSRPTSVDEVDADSLVAGLNGHGAAVRAAHAEAVAAGESVASLRGRIKALEAKPDPMLELARAVTNLAGREHVVNVDARTTVEAQPAPIVNVSVPEAKPVTKNIKRDDQGNIVTIVEE